jgi:hypothetical protein
LTVENIITRRDPGRACTFPGPAISSWSATASSDEFALVDELATWTAIALAAG